jgi:hypothetical protein
MLPGKHLSVPLAQEPVVPPHRAGIMLEHPANTGIGPRKTDNSHHASPFRPMLCARPALISDSVPHPTCLTAGYAAFRPYELAAALNRLRSAPWNDDQTRHPMP